MKRTFWLECLLKRYYLSPVTVQSDPNFRLPDIADMSSIKRSGTVKGDNSSALQRSATRKAVALTKKKVTLEDIQQGIKVLHAPDGHQDVE